MDVQAATSTYDCARPGCDGESYRPGGLCADHAAAGARETARTGRVLCRVCKTAPADPGTVGVRGRYGTICRACRDTQRAAAANTVAGDRNPASKTAKARRAARAPAPPKPPPAPAPGARPGLAEASAMVQAATDSYLHALADLEQAHRQLADAIDGLRG